MQNEKPMNRPNQPAPERGNGPKGAGTSYTPNTGSGARGSKSEPAEASAPAPARVEPKPAAAPETLAAAVHTQIEAGKAEFKELKDTVASGLASGLDDAKAVASDAIEKVEDVARDVQGKLGQAARGTYSAIKANPVPAAMVGLGGIGLAMLLANGASSTGASVAGGKAGKRRKEQSEPATPGAGEQITKAAGSARRSIAKVTSASTAMVQRGGRQAQAQARRLGRVVEENPMLVSAGALVVGVGIGLMLPRTKIEDQWLGATRDSIVEKGHALANKALDKVETARQLVSGSPEASESA